MSCNSFSGRNKSHVSLVGADLSDAIVEEILILIFSDKKCSCEGLKDLVNQRAPILLSVGRRTFR